MIAYENDEDAWRDYASSMSTSFAAGEMKGEAQGKKIGEKIGEEKGIKMKAYEMAKNCLNDGMSVEKTAKLTGLSEDEVRNISL